MAVLKGGDVGRFIQNPDRTYSVVLVHGPDAGLVHERSRAIARAWVDDPDDPFQLTRMDGDEFSGVPSRLIEEANTLGLFGENRAVWLRVGTKQVLSLVEPILAVKAEHPVVIQAGDLPPRHALRTAIERSSFSVSIACYVDEERDLPRVIDAALGSHGLKVTSDAKALLVGLLGADRLLTRQELDKLALYCLGRGTVTVDDVEAIMTDASGLTTDMVIDAVFLGKGDDADGFLQRSFREGEDGGVLASALLRHALLLSKARAAFDSGVPVADIERESRIFFKRSAAFRRHLTLWSTPSLDFAVASLADTVMNCRRQAVLSESLVSRICLTLATAARRASTTRA